MTKSEQICNDIGAKFFCKDFVYENLKYFNNSNNKVELCDGLFEYANSYVALQIKERSKSKSTKTDDQWLNEVVYGDAVSQIVETINGIKSSKILVNDLYHQKVELQQDYIIYPVIIFDNSNIKDYKRVLVINDIKINVFNLSDYKVMMNVLTHPYDILYYLQERTRLIHSNLPSLAIYDDEITIMSRINSEEDFAEFFLHMVYDGNPDKQNQALQLLNIINKFKIKQQKNDPHYKTILKILQQIEPKIADKFIERFNYGWSKAHEDKFDITKAIQLTNKDEKIEIVFCSIGKEPLTNKRYYEIICDAKQLQHKSNKIILIAFIGDKEDECYIEWVYFEKNYEPDPNIKKCYETFGMYDGTITKEFFEKICESVIK